MKKADQQPHLNWKSMKVRKLPFTMYVYCSKLSYARLYSWFISCGINFRAGSNYINKNYINILTKH